MAQVFVQVSSLDTFGSTDGEILSTGDGFANAEFVGRADGKVLASGFEAVKVPWSTAALDGT